MTVSVNNQSYTLASDSSIEQLLAQLEIESNGIAVAINNQITTKNNWTTTSLQEGDEVTIIKATQGG